MTPTHPKQLRLVDLIQQRRAELGHHGQPLPYGVIAQRSGLPRATVHKIATEGVHEVREDTLARLRAVAAALELPPELVEREALHDVGARVIERRLSDDEEILLSSYRQLSEPEVEQVNSYMRFLRSQKT